jgi:hypothetical protein
MVMAGMVAARPVLAQSSAPTDANDLFVQGNTALAHGDFTTAEKDFRAAIKTSPTLPGLWRNLGQALDGEKRYDGAVAAYQKYLDLAPDGEYASQVKARVLDDRRQLGVAPPADVPEGQGAIKLDVSIDGVEVYVDGIQRGATPLPPLAVTPGPHAIRLEKDGYQSLEQAVNVAADTMVTLRPHLEKGEAATTTQPAAAATGTAIKLDLPDGSHATVDGSAVKLGAPIPVKPGIHEVVIEEPGYERYRDSVTVLSGAQQVVSPQVRPLEDLASERRVAAIALGVAGAATAVGVGFGIAEAQTWHTAQDEALQETLRQNSEGPSNTRADLQALANRGHTEAIISYVGYGAAVAAVGTAIYFYVDSRQQAEQPEDDLPAAPTIALAPSIGRDGAQLSIAGTFGGGR